MVEICDFVVVGAGIAGASAAYELADVGSVVLIEMERTAGYHSTGRSAALYTECYGNVVIRRLARASKGFLEGPPEGFVDGPLLSERGVLFIGDESQQGDLAAAADDFAAMVPEVRRLDAAATRELVPVVAEGMAGGAVYEPPAMDIDVHALHNGYVGGVRRRGGDVRLSSKVIGLTPTGKGWDVETTTGRISTGVVVNAAGAWCDVVARMAGVEPVGLVPKRRTAFTFTPPAEHDHRGWPIVVGIDESFYFRPEGPYVFGSPADETPVEPQDIRHEEVDVAIAIERIMAATTMRIRSVHHAWAGLRSFVADKTPVAGEDPDHQGFFWLAGQGGYGIKTSPALARITASLVAAGNLPADVAALGLDRETLSAGRFRAGSGDQ